MEKKTHTHTQTTNEPIKVDYKLQMNNNKPNHEELHSSREITNLPSTKPLPRLVNQTN